MGVGLTIAGLLSLLVGIPAGHLADRRGAREILVCLYLLETLAMASFVLVHDVVTFVVAATAYTCTDKAANAVRQGLIAGAMPPDQRVSGRAYLRSVTNLGIGAGSLVAGVAIAIGTREAYVSMVLGDAVTYGLAALVILRLPRTPPAGVPAAGGMLVALRDRPYVVVTALQGLLGMHYVLLEVGVPLWVDRYTKAPTWTVALVFVVNTACCVLFQVRMARTAVDVHSSAGAVRKGSLLLGGSCAIFALSSGRSAQVAVGVLLVAALVNVAGELLQAAGSWGLGFGLAPEHAQGQYQGLYATGFAGAQMLGPIVVTMTVIRYGPPGWLVLGAFFVVIGCLSVPAAAWAQRSRASAGEEVPDVARLVEADDPSTSVTRGTQPAE